MLPIFAESMLNHQFKYVVIYIYIHIHIQMWGSTSILLIISADTLELDSVICAWNDGEQCMSKGENHLLVGWLRCGDGNYATGLMTWGVLSIWCSGPSWVTKAHPGSGFGLSECNRWQEPEGRHPMVLIFKTAQICSLTPYQSHCLCTLRQTISSQQVKYMKWLMT